MPRFSKKLVSRIKELRDDLDISQQELAKSVGVSRQTIYYLERGLSNPSLTLSLEISKILNKPVEEIFYFEPEIREFMKNKTLEELDDVSEASGIEFDRIVKLREITDDQLAKLYTTEELTRIAEAFGVKFEDLFLKDEDKII
ncbi:MAG: transcriptional regulator [Promethearchaeota archaeon]|nr:MAG: transcriptional regulator [Candidatus Lokiarchaeota archaeon]